MEVLRLSLFVMTLAVSVGANPSTTRHDEVTTSTTTHKMTQMKISKLEKKITSLANMVSTLIETNSKLSDTNSELTQAHNQFSTKTLKLTENLDFLSSVKRLEEKIAQLAETQTHQSNVLVEHSSTLSQQKSTVSAHSAILDQHSTTLKQQNSTLLANTGAIQTQDYGLSKLKEDVSKQASKLSLLGQTVTNQNTQIDAFKDDISAQSKNLANFNNQVTTLKQKQETAVMFTATLSKKTTLPDNARVIYDVVLTNIGNAYEKSSGLFRAPIEGHYMAYVSIVNQDNKNVAVQFQVNDNTLLLDAFADGDYSYKNSDPDNNSASQAIALHLKAGDTVSVVVQDSGNFMEWSGYHRNSFSVFLINAI